MGVEGMPSSVTVLWGASYRTPHPHWLKHASMSMFRRKKQAFPSHGIKVVDQNPLETNNCPLEDDIHRLT